MGLLVKLQNGDTALKSLKFGKDRPGGGDSNQPFIQDPILDNPLPSSPDFLLRGGLNTPINAAEDVARLTKYMFSLKSPSGLLFIAKQNILSRTSVATEASISAGYGNSPKNSLSWTKAPLNQGIYTPLSTLLQAGVGWTGTHLNTFGINPFTPMTGVVNGGFLPGLGIVRYEDVVRGETRLTKRIDVEKWIPDPSKPPSVPKYAGTDIFPGAAKNIKVVEKQRVPIGEYENRLIYLWEKDMTNTKNAGGNILEYAGGPGSILGIGKTKIQFGDRQRTGINNPLSTTDSIYFYKGGIKLHEDDFFPNYSTLLQASIAAGLDDSEIGIDENNKIDLFRKTGPHTPNYVLRPGSNYISEPLTGSNGYQVGLKRESLRPNDLNTLLGASLKEGLDDSEIGIVANGEGNSYFNTKYNPYSPNTTLSKDSKGEILSGSDGYQANRLAAMYSHETDLTYVSPINKILNASGEGSTTGVSGSGRQLLVDPKYDLSTGTFTPQDSEGKNLGEYSSENTLWNDNLNEPYTTSPKNHKKGYLANLDKNAGYYVDKKGNKTFQLAQYPRNIAPDFRKTSREVRGFTDSPESTAYDYRGTSSNYLQGKIIDKIYYSSGQKRISQELDIDNDIIPFKIAIVNPTSPSNVDATKILRFRAYVDSFSDQYSADWTDVSYIGRAEKQHRYSSFSRDISFSFIIVADNETNLDKMYEQLNLLASSLAPTYTPNGYMAGNLHRVTLGNYIVGQWGILKGFSYEVSDDAPYETKSGKQLPLYIKVNGVKFTPIHNFRPEYKMVNTPRFLNQDESINGEPIIN